MSAGIEPAPRPQASAATKSDKKHSKRKREAPSEVKAERTKELKSDSENKSKTKNLKRRKDAGLTSQTHIQKQPRGHPFLLQTRSLYLPLSPCAQDFPLQGLCAEHISPLLLTYYPPFRAVVLSYSNPRLSDHKEEAPPLTSIDPNESSIVLAQSIDEYAVTYVWLTVDFLLFRPRRDTRLEGVVGLQNESFLGLVCYNYFNAGIERTELPNDWRWVVDDNMGNDNWNGDGGGGRGYYVDGRGNKVEGKITFHVKDFETAAAAEMTGGTISIFGTLLPEEHHGN